MGCKSITYEIIYLLPIWRRTCADIWKRICNLTRIKQQLSVKERLSIGGQFADGGCGLKLGISQERARLIQAKELKNAFRLDKLFLRCYRDRGWHPRIHSESVMSLLSGLLFGSLAGYGAYQVSNDPQNVKISLLTAGILTTVMGVRFKRSGKLIPAGLIGGISLFMVLRLIIVML